MTFSIFRLLAQKPHVEGQVKGNWQKEQMSEFDHDAIDDGELLRMDLPTSVEVYSMSVLCGVHMRARWHLALILFTLILRCVLLFSCVLPFF